MNIQDFPFSQETAAQITAAIRTYHASISHRTKKAWFKAVDVEYVLTSILSGKLHAAVVDSSYLVVCDVGAPWYNPQIQVLEELMVLKIGEGGSLETVAKFLDRVASLNTVDYIAVGTALANNDHALARMYSRYGYVQEAIQLVKQR